MRCAVESQLYLKIIKKRGLINHVTWPVGETVEHIALSRRHTRVRIPYWSPKKILTDIDLFGYRFFLKKTFLGKMYYFEKFFYNRAKGKEKSYAR